MHHAARTPERTVAVTHPAVIRAALVVALNMPLVTFWRIDVPPLTATGLHWRSGIWTLRHACLPLTAAPPAQRCE